MKYNLLEALPKVLSTFSQLEVLEVADNKIKHLDDALLPDMLALRSWPPPGLCLSSAYSP